MNSLSTGLCHVVARVQVLAGGKLRSCEWTVMRTFPVLNSNNILNITDVTLN